MIEKSPQLKFEESLTKLERSLTYKKRIKEDPIYFDGIAKAFEVSLEYAWKYLKAEVEGEGIDVLSPKDALRRAGEIGLLDNVEQWISFINARNRAVHDYLGIPNEHYLEIADEYAVAGRRLLIKRKK